MEERDKGGFLWGLLGFVLTFPIALIIFFVMRNKEPKNARAVFIGGIVSLITLIFFIILTIFLGAMIVSNLSDTNIIENASIAMLNSSKEASKSSYNLFKAEVHSNIKNDYDESLVKLEEGYVYYDENNDDNLNYNEYSKDLELLDEFKDSVSIVNGELVFED